MIERDENITPHPDDNFAKGNKEKLQHIFWLLYTILRTDFKSFHPGLHCLWLHASLNKVHNYQSWWLSLSERSVIILIICEQWFESRSRHGQIYMNEFTWCSLIRISVYMYAFTVCKLKIPFFFYKKKPIPHSCLGLSSWFFNCMQNDVTSQWHSLDTSLKKTKTILLSVTTSGSNLEIGPNQSCSTMPLKNATLQQTTKDWIVTLF